MEKPVSYIALLLGILMLGIYITREITKSEYARKLDEIESVRDKLQSKMNQIDERVSTSDSLLQEQIQVSKDVIMELKSYENSNDDEIKRFENIIDSLANQLKEYSK